MLLLYFRGKAAKTLQTAPAFQLRLPETKARSGSVNRNRHRGRVVFPGEGDGALCRRPRSLMVYFRFLDHAGGLDICIFTLPRSCAGVVGQAPFPGFLVHDEHPVVRVGDVDEEGVFALGNGDDYRSGRSPSVSRVVAPLAPARQTG